MAYIYIKGLYLFFNCYIVLDLLCRLFTRHDPFIIYVAISATLSEVTLVLETRKSVTKLGSVSMKLHLHNPVFHQKHFIQNVSQLAS